MKESIIVLFFFSFGVLGGRLDLLPADWLGLVHEASNLAVYAMLAAVGMSLGFDSRAWRILRDLKGWVVLVPLMIIVGTFLGGVAAWTMLDMSFRDVMAVAAGFGYYSLSSMLINQLADVSLGSMALISNMVRELVTLLFAPLFARVFGGLGPAFRRRGRQRYLFARHYPYIGRTGTPSLGSSRAWCSPSPSPSS